MHNCLATFVYLVSCREQVTFVHPMRWWWGPQCTRTYYNFYSAPSLKQFCM